ncbi:hypothetical protein D3C78_1235430 [compost metagenome]
MLPWAISLEAAAMESAESRTAMSRVRKRVRIASMSAVRLPISSSRELSQARVRSPAATARATAPSSPSGWPIQRRLIHSKPTASARQAPASRPQNGTSVCQWARMASWSATSATTRTPVDSLLRTTDQRSPTLLSTPGLATGRSPACCSCAKNAWACGIASASGLCFSCGCMANTASFQPVFGSTR